MNKSHAEVTIRCDDFTDVQKQHLYNLCQHLSDFAIEEFWNLFAASQGKSTCDGIGRQ